MSLYAVRQALKNLCPDFVLERYYDLRARMWVNRSFTKRKEGVSINAIEIETVNRCNGICPFCPVNVNQPQRPYAKMSDELFRKIIDELSEMNYSGVVSIYSNNEPFLDERIIDFHKYASEKLPNARFCLYTNGSLLTFEKFIEIMPYLDQLVIDNYNDQKEINSPELKKIYDYIQGDKKLSSRVNFSFRLQNEVLTSRGGQSPNKQGMNDTRFVNVLCSLPFRQLVIRPTGEVSLCCNDALGKYTMGDLRTQSIVEVWNSEKYKALRQEMLKNGRKNLELCCNCDSIFTNTHYVSKRTRP